MHATVFGTFESNGQTGFGGSPQLRLFKPQFLPQSPDIDCAQFRDF